MKDKINRISNAWTEKIKELEAENKRLQEALFFISVESEEMGIQTIAEEALK